jgi:hypothetical protein
MVEVEATFTLQLFAADEPYSQAREVPRSIEVGKRPVLRLGGVEVRMKPEFECGHVRQALIGVTRSQYLTWVYAHGTDRRACDPMR